MIGYLSGIMSGNEFYRFAEALMEKCNKRANEKDRSATPWRDIHFYHLSDRLYEEESELDRALIDYMEDSSEENMEKVKDELIDVANFCMFMWTKLNGGEVNGKED